ncbi:MULTISPECIES: NAD-dependent epimerase/dehydratase family protein [Halomonadaceae]|uniref:NAD-dependent epimerase/dehydratase family protein n=1 Tax=Halomonadaceae TaxID=28256 RepID=UPI001118B756|nr:MULTISPECIES: NAD-dependent epimerase/dehydratase family protein [Halomonas]MCG7577263.1 NAD-dependent epimerase/dehydratase family protein [Halomonas sp. MMH1-48]MCG7591624.1 NAD-dependent epimerase/dehydratase family protein [Halomonas sp. McD50-5]MCG7604328.1 NAD-dependent epimerase/dehydratase family protein [Halomonas sp. MM17-34]MCG7613663.1 NAD-dependent epimerase/dehydratase family protein [Halomonas sp. MM17-29]MCG7617802.1 NAD-dependent epimerase/dehydratase family protein [Halomo
MLTYPHHVLVTGGAGFIGSHTVERLLQDNHRVRVLDNFSTGRLSNLPTHPLLDVVVGDIRSVEDVQTAMKGVTHCLHLAAQVSVASSVADPVGSATHNILGALNVMHAASMAHVSKLVYASSAAVYGIPAQLPLPEEAELQPLSPYGLEKWIDERYAALLGSLHGLPSLGLRYFNVYGPRQDPNSPYAGVIARFLDRLLSHQPPLVFGDGLQSRDFIYVGDIARANVAALFSPQCGICNVATGQQIDLLTLIDLLGQLTHCHLTPQHLPAKAEDIRDSCGNNRRLSEWLMIEPTWTLTEGLSELISYVSPAHGYLDEPSRINA